MQGFLLPSGMTLEVAVGEAVVQRRGLALGGGHGGFGCTGEFPLGKRSESSRRVPRATSVGGRTQPSLEQDR